MNTRSLLGPVLSDPSEQFSLSELKMVARSGLKVDLASLVSSLQSKQIVLVDIGLLHWEHSLERVVIEAAPMLALVRVYHCISHCLDHYKLLGLAKVCLQEHSAQDWNHSA